MDIWSILGIAATAEKAAIQAAYREKLAMTNPEDKPEEFKQLRAAYEQALKLAKQAAMVGAGPQTESERWVAGLNAVYMDIAQRQDESCWQRLLAEDFCMNLATRTQARDTMLRYLMQHYFLPRPIWQLLEAFFSLKENRNELMESFPQDFIEHAVYAGLENDELLPYHALTGPGDACDEWMRLYGRFRSAVNESDTDAMHKIVEEMESCAAWHPYLLHCKARIALAAEPAELEQAKEYAAQLLALLPDDTQALLLAGDCAMRAEDYAAADEIWCRLLEANPGYAQVQFNHIECLIGLNRHFEAKDLSVKLNKKLPNNPVVTAQMHAINKVVLPLRENIRAEEPDNTENLIELAWCYNQENRCGDALEVLQQLPGETMQGEYEYENLAAKVYLGNRMPQQALPHLRRWERAIRNLPNTEENAEKLVRLPEAVRLQAMVCEDLGMEEEAQELYFILQENHPDDVGCLEQLAQRALRKQEYETALHFAEHLVELANHEAFGFYLMGTALFHLHRRQESYNAFHETMQRAGRDAACLMYQCRILMDAGQWDDAKKILDDLTQAGVKGPILDYIKGRFAQHEARYGDAADLFEKLVEHCRSRKGEPLDFTGEVFFRLAGLWMDTHPKEDLLELVNSGLCYDPDGMSLLEMKADLLRQLDRPQEAIEVLLRVAAFTPTPRHVCESLGRLYQYFLRDYQNAVEWYRKQLEIEESPIVYNILGLALQELRRYKESEEAFIRAMELDPDCAAYVANRAGLYLVQNKTDDAEFWYLQALAKETLDEHTHTRLRRDLARLDYRRGRYRDGISCLMMNVKQRNEYADLAEVAEGYARMQDLPAAMKALQQWLQLAGVDETEYLQHKADLLLKVGKSRKALAVLRRIAGRSMPALHLLAVTYADTGRYRIAEYLLRRILKLDPKREDSYAWLSKALLWQGKEAQAMEVAQQGLALLEEDKFRLDRAMYDTRKAIYLTLLNRLDEASALLKEVEHTPLCRFCSYGSCKDGHWVECFVLERAGKTDEALALYEQYAKQHPDEYDFVAGVNRLRKRNKRNYDRRH